ncbi:universal stress protein UspB [Enterovibrio norvegicus]|uniref:Universal stress protein B n=2 Tax=Enterovibrio norvegicus TaxID=188144 RepID=A0A2N7L8V9_9GAMM|nr:universal stress protein UspB [Enterovibrio norvegicus]MCC4800819.1 universal stress protein UspB [Enterovibrio norvegicus]OEE45586.1 universal stress protein UspB [Enterovibrio norvegicus]OEF49216.1 universal stress protein UspB [Enterovibrio norvegicus]OEF53230.1 universal stress protein UspB [Enterovibrio norvegicus]PMH72374.1 universal stress protein UspB [Enterovibrio norvegicus]
MSGDALIIAIFFVTLANILRYFSSLRALLSMMREANPLLYQQMHRGNNNFFSSQGDISRQKRLYHYIRSQEYLHHHDDAFIAKCNKVRHLFILSTALVLALVVSLFFVAFAGL